ncbi:MAG: LLM class flavin-dependent oxidoreductase [Liquorilactobacillus ghanensis]|uniref:LLM class flavin-dependent oxidoreductase n=1 Tax=Liquorilactobacillus ghanensis TaxID=399370 RepID=UPI0039EA291C
MTKQKFDPAKIDFGLDSFGDIPLSASGQLLSQAAAIRQVVAEGVLADELGLKVIALGEHHRADYAISSPDVVLAALAARTKQITLASGVTVLSSDDPVRVYERFATLAALSNSRAEVVLGRGSFLESFPLYGYDLRDYDLLFEDKLSLFAELLKERPVTWSGKTRSSLKQMDVFPKTEQALPVRIAVGGTPASVVRTAKYGFPLTLAIIGGRAERFLPYVQLYQRAADQYQQPIQPLAVHSHGLIAATDDEAKELAWKYLRESFVKVGQERGWAPMGQEQFNFEINEGSFYVGSPETVAQRLAQTIKQLGVSRFELAYGAGGLPAAQRMKVIELYAQQVVPRVRELLAEEE